MDALNLWKLQLEELLSEISEQIHLEQGGFFVVGCSTSEVAGKRIGTAGAMEIAEVLYEPLKKFADKHHLHLAFQGCEHINRALTIERHVAKKFTLDPVSVIPTRNAGGSMSASAFESMTAPVLVASINDHPGQNQGPT